MGASRLTQLFHLPLRPRPTKRQDSGTALPPTSTSRFPLMGQALSPLPTGALQIESSEETDQGKYECVATNSAGVRYSSPANLYVRGRERCVQVEGRDPPHPSLSLLGLTASGLPCPLQTPAGRPSPACGRGTLGEAVSLSGPQFPRL